MALRGAVRNRVLTMLFMRQRPLSASYFYHDHRYGKKSSIFKALTSLEKQGLLISAIEPRRPGTQGSLRRMYSLTLVGYSMARLLQSLRAARQTGKHQPVEEIVHPTFF